MTGFQRAFDRTEKLGWRCALGVVDRLSPRLATRLVHRREYGQRLELDDPRDFNDKLQWLKLYGDRRGLSRCADKYAVRQFAAERGCAVALSRLIGLYEGIDAIVWEELPARFALKCTHGCGYNVIIDDKRKADERAVKRRLQRWLKERYARRYLEYHYDAIPPRVLAEEYIETATGGVPVDYKVYCFHGRPRVVLVCTDRGGDLRFDFHDPAWQRLELNDRQHQSPAGVARPRALDEMLELAERLSRGFVFVRVDFYEREGRAVLGEMTFTPGANVSRRYNAYGQRYLGDLIDLTQVGRRCRHDREVTAGRSLSFNGTVQGADNGGHE
ncbi:MAG: hypothetical protein GYB54_20015 [Gammaproteobacteria bacterium]|nr:hypothetical protein [Gammaproteobacteria bacterium]